MSLTEVWAKGSEGAIDLAQKVVSAAEDKNEFTYMYDLSESISDKIRSVAQKFMELKM